jgi:hypothetical protein
VKLRETGHFPMANGRQQTGPFYSRQTKSLHAQNAANDCSLPRELRPQLVRYRRSTNPPASGQEKIKEQRQGGASGQTSVTASQLQNVKELAAFIKNATAEELSLAMLFIYTVFVKLCKEKVKYLQRSLDYPSAVRSARRRERPE